MRASCFQTRHCKHAVRNGKAVRLLCFECNHWDSCWGGDHRSVENSEEGWLRGRVFALFALGMCVIKGRTLRDLRRGGKLADSLSSGRGGDVHLQVGRVVHSSTCAAFLSQTTDCSSSIWSELWFCMIVVSRHGVVELPSRFKFEEDFTTFGRVRSRGREGESGAGCFCRRQ